jgi:hypothetical protein
MLLHAGRLLKGSYVDQACMNFHIQAYKCQLVMLNTLPWTFPPSEESYEISQD